MIVYYWFNRSGVRRCEAALRQLVQLPRSHTILSFPSDESASHNYHMADQHPPALTPSVGYSDHIRPRKPQGRKRKRVSVACRSCRVRKSRVCYTIVIHMFWSYWLSSSISQCDGAQPCSTCEDMDTECRYEQPYSQPVAITNPGSSER